VRTIAHEVRNPLNNITLSIEQMQQDIKDEHSQLYMNIIQRNGKRISDLISELLNTSRPSENTLEKQAFQNILDDVIAASIDRMTLKRIKLQVSYPDTELKIMADREKLKLALLNVVINAVEAMEEEVGELSILLQNISGNALLTISDNGCGISEENISRLFEPYFTQKRNGVGLGLTFTLNILQAHKAVIDVSSSPGKGTVFAISFPLA
jgi:signal transduction histidine kinase